MKKPCGQCIHKYLESWTQTALIRISIPTRGSRESRITYECRKCGSKIWQMEWTQEWDQVGVVCLRVRVVLTKQPNSSVWIGHYVNVCLYSGCKKKMLKLWGGGLYFVCKIFCGKKTEKVMHTLPTFDILSSSTMMWPVEARSDVVIL